MGRSLPIHTELPRLAVERVDPAMPNRSCDKCSMHEGVRSVCMGARSSHDETKGSVLFVGDFPVGKDDALGKPMQSDSGNLVRYLARQHWNGPAIYDNALKCAPGSRVVRDTHLRACRPYLAQTIHDAQPSRIIAMGSQAIFGVLGRGVPPLSARRGFTWITETMTPVFMLMAPSAAMRNGFTKRWFEKDLVWALKADLSAEKRRAMTDWDGIVQLVEDEDDCKAAVAWAERQRFIAYDFETVGKIYETGTKEEPGFRALLCSISSPDDPDVWAWEESALYDDVGRAALRRILESRTIPKVGQNEKYDRHCAGRLGIAVENYTLDTRLVRKIIDPEADARLEVLQELVGMGGGKEAMSKALASVIAKCKMKPLKKDVERGSEAWMREEFGENYPLAQIIRSGCENPKAYAFGLVDRELLLRYNAMDARTTAVIGDRMIEDLKASPPELTRVWEDLVRPLSVAICHVERWGIHVDKDAIEAFQSITMLRQQESLARIHQTASRYGMANFSPSNTREVQDLLFERLKIKPREFTPKGQPSTSVDVLEKLAEKHPICADLIVYRKVSKNRGTYADPLSAYVLSDGRVHPSIKLDGTRTGRPSCENPNLFNIPRSESEEGKMARDCFAAPSSDFVILNVDYSQLELRVAAIESKDPNMRKIFLDGVDFHMATAKLVSRTAWGIAPEACTKEHRSASKAINFGILYGMGPWALAANIGVTPEEAEKTMHAILGGFPLLRKYRDARLAEAQRTGFVWTTWNGERFRRRPLWRVADKDGESASRAKNGSLNTPVQGKASDFCLKSLVRIVQWIIDEGIEHLVKLTLTVYDSLMFEVHKSMLDETIRVVAEIMLDHPTDGVPIVVEAETGPAWGSLEACGSFSNMKSEGPR